MTSGSSDPQRTRFRMHATNAAQQSKDAAFRSGAFASMGNTVHSFPLVLRFRHNSGASRSGPQHMCSDHVLLQIAQHAQSPQSARASFALPSCVSPETIPQRLLTLEDPFTNAVVPARAVRRNIAPGDAEPAARHGPSLRSRPLRRPPPHPARPRAGLRTSRGFLSVRGKGRHRYSRRGAPPILAEMRILQ